MLTALPALMKEVRFLTQRHKGTENSISSTHQEFRSAQMETESGVRRAPIAITGRKHACHEIW